MTKTTLSREAKFYNPFIMDGKEINSIRFYNDGKVVVSSRWFGNNNSYKCIEFPFEVKKATKENLNRKDAYYLRSSNNVCKSYDLYIHTSLVDLQFVETKEDCNTWYSNRTKDVFTISLTGVRYCPKLDDFRNLVYEEKSGTFCEKFDGNYTSEDTTEYKRCKALAEKMSNCAGKEISVFNVHDLLEHFDIKEKKNKK